MMWIQRAILIVLAPAMYAGLAVLGGGGIGPFFSRPARGALLVVLLASSAAAFFTDASMSAGVREDRSNRVGPGSLRAGRVAECLAARLCGP
jgi:hypothetical protein